MIAAIVALAVGGFGFATTAIALAIRRAGMLEHAARIESQLALTQGELAAAIDEMDLMRERQSSELGVYRSQLRELREAINALPDNPGNRIAVLGELERLLSGEKTDNDHGDQG